MVGAMEVQTREDYERNPVLKQIKYNAAGIAPHGDTQRAVYTVPAGKRAKYYSGYVHVMRTTAAAPVGITEISIMDASAVEVYVRCHNLNNVIGNIEAYPLGFLIVLATGDTISIHTSDVGTGGTNDFNAAANGVEIDA